LCRLDSPIEILDCHSAIRSLSCQGSILLISQGVMVGEKRESALYEER
jgi:hypothetical protein